jgi:hypothetical protein
MADDPFAQYAVKADDPFAAYADGAGATDGAAAVRKQIVSGFKARPIFEPGAGAAMLGAQSDPSEVLPSALNAVNPINWIKGLASAARLATNPQEIPGAANDALSQVLAHPGAAAGSAFAGAAMPPLMARVPAGRLLTAGTAGAKAGALRLPLVGPPMRAATRAAYRSWQETAPVAAETAAEVAAPTAAEAIRRWGCSGRSRVWIE